MSLETASYIGQLNPAWPDGDADDASQGDDQLRLIKTVLQTQFPNLGNAAITATAAQINTAAISAGQYTSGTSTSSLTVALGAQAFVTQAGLGFVAGMRLRLVHRINLANTMEGLCAAYDKVTGAASITADAISGSGTYADWSVFVVLDVIIPEEKQRNVTGADTLVPGDRGKVLHYTGTADSTLALTAAATVGNGNFCTLRNASNTNWTIDPAGAELICGQATVVIKPGFTARLKCDGVGFDLQWTKQRSFSLDRLVQVTSNTSETIGPDTYVRREYAVGAGSQGIGGTRSGASGGMAWGDIPVKPGDTLTRTFAAGTVTVAVNGVTMLTGGAASGATAGTASKHASVTNGGTSNGAAATVAAGDMAGPSSGSPLGAGVSVPTGGAGGAGWGGVGLAAGGGGGTAGPALAGRGGRAISASAASAEPLLSLLSGTPGVSHASGAGDGGPGAGGGYGTSAAGGNGGIGAGGGLGGPPGASGFGGGGAGAGSGATFGTPGCGGGGAVAGGGANGPAGVAGVLYFKEYA